MLDSLTLPSARSLPLPSGEAFIPQLSVDCVVFGYREGELKVLVPRLAFREGFHTLPGGFVRQEESVDAAALRVLRERTGLTNIYLEQFRVFGDAGRSDGPLMRAIVEEASAETGQNYGEIAWLTRRFVSVGYYALVDIRRVVPVSSQVDASIDWHPVEALPQMILDHNDIALGALQSLRSDLDEKLNGFNLLPEKFTMRELRELYQTVHDRPFTRGNFQKKMLGLGVLERLEKKFTGAANKAPYLYRFNRR